MSKIIGNTVGMGLPKPNLMQNDPTKGDYVYGKEEFLQQTGNGAVTNEQIASAVEDYMAEHPVTGGDVSVHIGAEKPTNGAIYWLDTSADEPVIPEPDVPDEPDEPHAHSYTSSVTKAATCETAGVRTFTCSCGHSYTENIPATGHNYVDGVCTVCGATDPNYEPDEPEKTLTSISATYSGGEVDVGTAVTALTGIVVTAHYSDGSTETVTGYTLSGTIAEGNNTITVSYSGKTATFIVVGVAESGGEVATYEEFAPECITFGRRNAGLSSASDLLAVIPDTVTFVAKNVQEYWSSGHQFYIRESYNKINVAGYSNKTITVDGVRFGCIIVTKVGLQTTYDQLIAEGKTPTTGEVVMGNNDGRFDSNYKVRAVVGEADENIIAAMSADWEEVTA